MSQERTLDTSITSVYEAHKYAEDYWDKFIKKDSYELYEITAKYDKNMVGEWNFIYTKRSGFFRDVYFIKINTKNNTVKAKRRDEAKRMYGMDYIIDIESWNFDESNIWKYAEDIPIDAVRWTVLEGNRISIDFIKDGFRVFTKNISAN